MTQVVRVLVVTLALAVDSQASAEIWTIDPAHTVAEVRLGGLGFVVGTWSAVGVDTAFTPLPAPVLGRDVQPRGRAVRLVRRLGPPEVLEPLRRERRAGARCW